MVKLYSSFLYRWRSGEDGLSVGKRLPREIGGNRFLGKAHSVLGGPNAQIKELDFLGPLKSMNTLLSLNNNSLSL